jgi:plasmid maintenance system killer protein
LELAFQNTTIREICEDEDKAKVELGPAIAKALQNRLADLDAAPTVKDLPIGNPSELTGDRLNTKYKLDLIDGYRLVFCCNHVKPPMKYDKIDWEKVSHIQILQIEDTNDQK